MNEVIGNLLALQEVDERILYRKKKLEEGPRTMEAANAELAAAKARADETARRAKEAGRTAERKNGELEAVDKKMKDLSAKQNTARSNKEYEAFKHEIAGLKADRDLLEEEALKQWEISEVREEEADRERKRIAEIEAKLGEKHREWEEQAVEWRTHLDELLADRTARAAKVPEQWLRVYERVLGIRGCPAVVEIVEQYCRGCQRNVTIHDVTRAMRGVEVVQCRSCNRILYANTL